MAVTTFSILMENFTFFPSVYLGYFRSTVMSIFGHMRPSFRPRSTLQFEVELHNMRTACTD